MVNKIIWSRLAKLKLFEIHYYYKLKVNILFANNLVRSIKNHPNILLENPFLGQKDKLLENFPIQIRYLVFKNYKILYSFNQNFKRIEIHNLFDTRRNPTKILE